MHRYPFWIGSLLASALIAACAVSPADPSSSNGHDTAARTHTEFARDFENAGNDAKAEHHARQAEKEMQKKFEEQCGLLCVAVEALENKSSTVSGPPCRDPITTSPAMEPRC